MGLTKLKLKLNPIQSLSQRKVIIGIVLVLGLVIIIGSIAFAMNQFWCEPCKIIKMIGG
jgi:hypothetical protein